MESFLPLLGSVTVLLLAGTVTASGFGCIVGPAFAGFIAQYFGLAAPFSSRSDDGRCDFDASSIHLEGSCPLEPIGVISSVRSAMTDLRYWERSWL